MVFGNGLVIYVLSTSPNLEGNQYKFIFSLSLIDLTLAVIITPVFVMLYVTQDETLRDAVCQFAGWFGYSLALTSLMNLTLISLDRYYACCHPLHYHQKLTPQRVKRLILASWIFGYILAAPPLFGWGRYVYVPYELTCGLLYCRNVETMSYLSVASITCFLPCILTINIVYYNVIKVARNQRKKIQAVNNAVFHKRTHDVKKFQTAFTFGVVIGAYFSQWTPYVGARLYGFYFGDTAAVQKAKLATLIIYGVCPVLNPIIYSFSHGPFKKEVKKKLGLVARNVDITPTSKGDTTIVVIG
ncbi:rhodopsin-like [Saccoglossus kowalevskii]|uniref:Melanopsin-like n=1 Tax=Saccoglossus kowalevskii TaxID=10224 RepID=A0ABM0M4M4_SACKO|nr:PREDICTED: melanopsin-like [Saccoglossus kowalevskii]